MEAKVINRIVAGLALCCIALVVGCSREDVEPDMLPSPASENGIEICGGVPAGPLMESRVSEPSRPGFCDADMMRVWTFRSTSLGSYPGVSALTFDVEADVKVTHYNQDNPANKMAYYHYFGDAGLTYTTLAAPALAYKLHEAGDFHTEVDPGKVKNEEKHYENLILKLDGKNGDKEYNVPELFFGQLIFDKKGGSSAGLEPKLDKNGTFNIYKGFSGNDMFKDCAMKGTLYRVVSQLNITVNEINPDAVDHMELFIENLPTEMGLVGNHGYYYPVRPAEGPEQHESDLKLLASTGPITTTSITLSTFLLPTLDGYTIKVRVWFNAIHENGEAYLRSTDFDLFPARTVKLTGEDTEVYDPITKVITIFDGTALRYYSYSNVRVNLSGKFEDMFTTPETVDVNVEICPRFEGVHDGFTFTK